MDIENKLIDAIEAVVNNAIEKATFDKTIQGVVSKCEDPTIGKYTIKYQDSSFYAYSTSSEVKYKNGVSVYILVPGNDMSQDKTILGAVEKLGADYAVTAEGDEAYDTIGVNCINSKDTIELCSYNKDGQVKILYDKENNINLIKLDAVAAQKYITQSSSIICGAVVKTDLPTEQRLKGNYGIVYELVFEDNATGAMVKKNYIMDVNQMTGNPYKVLKPTRQYGIFTIDGINFKYVNRIYAFAYDFPNKADNKKNDLFLSSIELCGATRLSDDILKSTIITFNTPDGDYFSADAALNSQLRVLAKVRVKGKVIDTSSQLLDYYWFKENSDIEVNSEKYNPYGGEGWECLNLYNIINDETNAVEWVPGSYEYIVHKSDLKSDKNKYKCVVIYNDDTIIEKEITVIDYGAQYELSIGSDAGTQFYYDIGSPTLTCLINGKKRDDEEFSYSWSVEKDEDGLNHLDETTELNNKIASAKAEYEQLLNDIEHETRFENATKAEMDALLTELKEYDKMLMVNRNQTKVFVNSFSDKAVYKCSVYKNGEFLGTASITLYNTLIAEGVYNIILNNGSQVFKYNEGGVSPTNQSLENPMGIEPLSFTIYDNLGNPLQEEITNRCKIEWEVPTENTLISVPGAKDELKLVYTIDKKYDIQKTNNNIKLTVTYKGMKLKTQTNFTFTKEGEPGTNGTDFACRIVPNTSTGLPLYPMITNGKLNYTPAQANKWFKVQLFHNGERVFEGTTNGTSTENKSIKVKWEVLKNKYGTQSDESSIEVTGDSFTYNNYKGSLSPANIVKCTITYTDDDKRVLNYYATMPVITAQVEDKYGIELKENTGFRYAVYTADGRSPQYDNTNPFELKVTELINNIKEDISELTAAHSVDCNWIIRGAIYTTEVSGTSRRLVKVDDKHIGEVSTRDLKRNQKVFKPLDDYDGQCVTNAIECIVSRGGNDLARIHIPIHMLLNKYGNAAINGWDGNSVSIDENGSGMILAPQVGAGQKESDNTYTGMLMGKVKEAGKQNAEVGLLGYNHGERTLFLNSKDGSAIFGKNNSGQIIIDPSTNKALLYSHNYWKNYDVEDGKPTSYSSSNLNNEGMLIDLTTPQIRFGNGNFEVNADGHLVAKGGGEIAGWTISDDDLTKNKLTIASNRKGPDDGENKIPAIFSNGKNTMNTNKSGFYIGSDGFALGAYSASKGHNPFQVNEEGSLFSNSGSIGGFTIDDNTLIGGSGTNTVGMSSKSGVQWAFWSGADNAGDAPFHVGHNGELHSSKGEIGGWTIGTDKLTGGNMYLNKDGSIGGSKWSITKDGYATFSDVYITNTNTSLSATQKLIDLGNFYVTAGGDMHASSGSISGSIVGSGISANNISSGSMSASRISGGTLNISTKGGGYLTAGANTTHVNVSGINIGSAGIAMQGNGIGDCGAIQIHNEAVGPSTTFYIQAWSGSTFEHFVMRYKYGILVAYDAIKRE